MTHGLELRTGLSSYICLRFTSIYDSEDLLANPWNSAGFGAAYGTAKSGLGVTAAGVLRPDLLVKSSLLLHRLLFGILD